MSYYRNGLGFTPIVASAAASGPAAPIVIAGSLAIMLFPKLLAQFGRGRAEANTITPVQNQIGDRLAQINAGINSANVQQLQMFLDEVRYIGDYFIEFVSGPDFEDGRASVQALDTIMPLVDGTCGYDWPPPMNPSPQLCRADLGTTGSIQRRIIDLGGIAQGPQVTQGYGSMTPTLRVPQQTYPWIPQAGTIYPIAPLSEIQGSPIYEAGLGSGLLPVLALGAVAFMAFRNRG